MLQGEENEGMAMTFTLVSHLREKLSGLVENRVKARVAEEHERERLAIEVRSLLDSNHSVLIDCRVRRRRHALAGPQSRLCLSRFGRLNLTKKCHRENYGMKKTNYVPLLLRRGRRSRKSELASLVRNLSLPHRPLTRVVNRSPTV